VGVLTVQYFKVYNMEFFQPLIEEFCDLEEY